MKESQNKKQTQQKKKLSRSLLSENLENTDF